MNCSNQVKIICLNKYPNIEQLIFKWITQSDNIEFLIRISPTSSLRGGGCVGFKSKINGITYYPNNARWIKGMEINSQLLVDKCYQVLDNFSRNEIMMSLQWFSDNRNQICEICKNDKMILMLYDIALKQFRQLISVIQVYLRGSGCLCYYILEVCNDLLLIIYTYQRNFETRFLQVEVRDELLQQIGIIIQDLEVHNNFWTNGLNFQLTLIKIVLINSKTNSKEEQNKLIQIASSAFSSLLSLSINEDFTDALYSFAKYLIKQQYNQFKFPIKTYEIYYFFFFLKQSIIKNIQEKKAIDTQIANLSKGFELHVKNSDNWIVHFCWINAISDLISYRQILSETDFSQGQDGIKKKYVWNKLITQQIIQVLSYDKQLGKINNSISFKSIDYDQEKVLNNLGLKNMQLFQNAITNQQFTNKQNFFQFYVDFTFKKLKKPEQLQKQQHILQLLDADEQLKKLQRLCQLLKEIKEQISKDYIECSIESLPTSPQEFEIQNNMIQYDLALDKQGIHKLDVGLFKLSYLINEIDFTMIIEKKRIEICYQLTKQDKNQKRQSEKEKKKRNKCEQLEDIYNEWVKLDIPNSYCQIFDIIAKLKRFHFQYSEAEKKQSDEQQKIQQNDWSQFIQNIQNQIEKIEKFVQRLDKKQKSLLNYWKINNIKVDEQLDQTMNEFFLDIIIKKQIKFTNDEYHKEFKVRLMEQKFQTFENIKNLDLDIQNYIKMMKILKGQLIHKAYLFSQLELNLKSTLEIKYSRLKQQDNIQQLQISIHKLILEQKEDIYTIIQKGVIDKNSIQKIIEQIVSIIDKIVVNLAYQKNNLLDLALILLNQLYNSFYKLSLSSSQNLGQFKDEIEEYFNEYKESQQNQQNNFQVQTETETVSIEKNEYFLLISKKLTELNQQIKNICFIINNLEVLSQYVHENCIGCKYLSQDNFPRYIINNVKSIFKELINKLELEKLLNELIQNILNKNETQKNELKNKINFCLQDFASIFCYNQTITEKKVQIDKEYQEILNYLEEEMIVERKFYDLSEDYIVRECFLFHLIKMQSQVPEKGLLLICQKYVQQMWMIEKDESVRAFLKNKEMIEMQKLLFSHDLKSLSTSIKDEMNQKLKNMDEIEQAIRFEGNRSNRDKLQEKLRNNYEEFEQFLDNIQEMSQQLDITLIFLKELQKNVKQIKKSIEDLQEQVNDIGNDVRKLRGKKYEELFQIRKEKVLQQALLLELDSVYIPLNTQEINPDTGEILETRSGLSQLLVEEVKENNNKDKEGEVNQFIYEEKDKDVMLIKGQAGSGKSRAARKIEEYLWKQHSEQNDWIPLYISLPQLKNPKFNLLDQALESENYGFDKVQLNDFKEAVQNHKIQVVMILDSYDEMKQDCIQANLILTNRLREDLNQINQKKNVKFIITTRKEILTSLGYQTWFYGESLQTLKEVEIMSFDENQSETYLYHYVKLSIKRRIRSQYDFVKQIKQQNLDVIEFKDIWNQIQAQIIDQDEKKKNNNSAILLTDYQIENILDLLKEKPVFQNVQKNQLIILKKELKDLWSADFFNTTIKDLNIQDFIQTPFMLEIVVQTLPSLSKKYKGSHEIKETFQNNFLLLRKKQNLSKKLLFENQQQERQKGKSSKDEIKNQQIQQIEQDQEDLQDVKSLKQILDKLESQRFFENFSITDISSVKNNLKNISEDELKLVISALKMKKFTSYEFYQNFIEFYHEQQIQKLRQLGQLNNVDSFIIDLEQFSESLAIEMTIHQTTQVNYEQKGRLKLTSHYFHENDEDNWKMQYFDDLEDQYRKLIRSSALINVKGKNYSFNHKSIQEFFVAQHINNLIDKIELKNDKITEKSQIYLHKSALNRDKFLFYLESYVGSLNLLKQKLQLKDENTLKLISIAKLSRKNKQVEPQQQLIGNVQEFNIGNDELQFKIASSNSFCLLSYLQVYLGEQNFQGIKIEKTSLKGLSFYKSEFQNSIFKEVIIDSCLFDEANLENAKWEKMMCSEKPLLDGHQEKVILLQYSNDGKFIASLDKSNVIKFWNVQTYKQEERAINDIQVVPKFLVFSADDQMLFVGGENQIESWMINDKIIKTKNQIYKEEKIILMQLSQNEKELLTVDEKGLIQFWDVSVIKSNSTIKDEFLLKNENQSEITFIEFFQNGEMLACVSDDNKVTIWNVIEQKVLTIIVMPFQITYLAINQTSEFLICVSNSTELQNQPVQNKVTLWNIKKQQVFKEIELPFKITYLAINNTSEFLFCVSNSSQLQNFSIWNIKDNHQPKQLVQSSKFKRNNVLLTLDENQIIEYLDDAILIQNISTLYNKEENNSIQNFTCIDFSSDENLIALSNENQIQLWQLSTQTHIRTLENDQNWIEELVFIEKGKKLLSANQLSGLTLWSVEKCQLITIIEISYKNNLIISSDFDMVALQTRDRDNVVIISLKKFQSKLNYSGLSNCHRQRHISISQNDQLVLSESKKQQKVTQLENAEDVEFENYENHFQICAFSHNSSLFASYCNEKVQIWTYEGVKFQEKFVSQFNFKISFMLFSYDDQYIAITTKKDQATKIWDFHKNQIISLKEPINNTFLKTNYMQTTICFSYDSSQVAFYNNDQIKIWKFISDSTATFIQGDNSSVKTIASSPKQNYFATSSKELNIKFWSFETKQLLHQIKTAEQTNCLCFSYDGKYLISAKSILKLWDIQNFPQIKLCSASKPYYHSEGIDSICCLHQKQGILFSYSDYSQIIQFDEFIYQGVLESTDKLTAQFQFSADSQFLLGGIEDKVVIWNSDKDYQIDFSFTLPDIIQSATYCQDQERIVVSILTGIYILNIKSNNLIEVIPNMKSALYAKFFFNEKYLYTKEKQSVKIWSNDGNNKFTIIDYYNYNNNNEDIIFSYDGKYIAILERDQMKKQNQIKFYPVYLKSIGRFIYSNGQIRLSNDQKYLLKGNSKNSQLLDFKSDKILREFPEFGIFEFCPDNQNIVFQNEKYFKLHNIESQIDTILLEIQKDCQIIQLKSIQTANSGKLLVITDRDEKINLISIEDLNKPQFIGAINHIVPMMNSGEQVYPKTSNKYLAQKVGKNLIQIIDLINRKFVKSNSIKIDKNVKLNKHLAILYNLDRIEKEEEQSEIKIESKKIINTQNIDTIAISKNRKNVVFSFDDQISYCENRNIDVFNKLGENMKFLNFSFSQDSKYLVGCGNNKTIYFWDFKARKIIAKFQGHTEMINQAQISQDNSTLASCSDDKLIRFWNLNANFNKIAQDGHQNEICNIEFSQDGLVLYSGSMDKTLNQWDMQNKVILISKTFHKPITSFAITQNQEYLIIAQGCRAQLWNIEYNQSIKKSSFEIITGAWHSSKFKTKGCIKNIQSQLLPNDYIFTLTLFTYKEQNYFSLVEIWEKKDIIGKPEIVYKYANIEISLYQISQNFKYICSVDSQNILTLGELSQTSKANLIKLKDYHKDKIMNLLFSNDSKILSSVDSQNVVFRILDKDELLFRLKLNIEPKGFFQYFTEDDKYYYTNFNNNIYLWDVNHLIKDQNIQIQQLGIDLENLDIHYFTISNNLIYLAFGFNDSQNNNGLRVVELNSKKTLKTLDQNSKINLLVFSEDDILLAVANELNEILIYEIDQFTIKYSYKKCHKAQIITMQFFFYQPNQIKSDQENKKNIISKSILSLVSFDSNYSIVINYLDTNDQKVQDLDNQQDYKIQSVIFTKNVQTIAVITYNDEQNKQFKCFIYQFSEEKYILQKKIQDRMFADFCFDDNFLIYCNWGSLYLLDLKKILYSNYDEIKVKNNEPFDFLKMSTSKSILFTGNNEQICCQILCHEKDQAQLILLKKIEINQLDYSKMLLRQVSQIFYLANKKIQRLDFSDAVGKLKSCINYQTIKKKKQEYDTEKEQELEIHFKNCSFSSDLSLCVCEGEEQISQDKQRQQSENQNIILWNVRTLEYQILWQQPITKDYEDNYDPQQSQNLIAVAIFYPKQNIMVSSESESIVFRDCKDFNSITIITSLKDENRIKNLIISKNEKLLISICESGNLKLWNVSNLTKIILQRVIYCEKELIHFRFTNDICCYSFQKNKDEKTYYLEQINLTKYIFQSFQYFDKLSIMQQKTIIALGGAQLVLWNYNTNQNIVILEKKIEQIFSSVVFENNSDYLVASRGEIINLIKVESAEPIKFTKIKELEGHQDEILCLSISIIHGNSMIISGSKDRTIRFWSIKQLALVYCLDGFIQSISKIRLSPNCKDMAVAMQDGSIRLYKLEFENNIHDSKYDEERKNDHNYIHCYRIFGRQNLISAKNCILKNTIIQQVDGSLEQLFIQKKAKKEDQKEEPIKK